MPDREKVIKQLENDAIATDTGYVEVPLWLLSEIIALLKKQEAVEPIPPTDESDMWRCGNCKHQIFRCRHQRFCEKCGKAVKWG